MDETNPQQNQTLELQEIEELEVKLKNSSVPDELRDRAEGLIKRLKKVIRFGSFSQEFESVEKYIDWITQIPWGVYTVDNLDINDVRQKMDKHHYGLTETKDRILEYLAVLKLNTARQLESTKANSDSANTLRGSSSNAPILCFVGIQGVGKTSLAKSIASALGRTYYRIALGGMTTVTALRGTSKTETDSEPGQIIKGLVRTGTMNPMILLDEIDKISTQSGVRADVMAALLEILDPEQNSSFGDHYLDYPMDLSKVMFITTANNLGGISAALLDRLEIIRFSSYSDDDKVAIGKDYMLPKVLKSTGLTEDQIVIADDVWPLLVRPLGFDAGIRE
jgi:ATP-dependent Lon protease